MYTRDAVRHIKLPTNFSKISTEALNKLHKCNFFLISHDPAPDEILCSMKPTLVAYVCLYVLEGRDGHQNSKRIQLTRHRQPAAQSSKQEMICWKWSRTSVLVAAVVRSDLLVDRYRYSQVARAHTQHNCQHIPRE
jgi:hypothetical protein